jgi:antitoxin VapB
MAKARVIWDGDHQTISLPRQFHLEGTEVNVRREGERVILEPVRRREWSQRFWDSLGRLDPDFERPLDLPTADREPLDA